MASGSPPALSSNKGSAAWAANAQHIRVAKRAPCIPSAQWNGGGVGRPRTCRPRFKAKVLPQLLGIPKAPLTSSLGLDSLRRLYRKSTGKSGSKSQATPLKRPPEPASRVQPPGFKHYVALGTQGALSCLPLDRLTSNGNCDTCLPGTV